MDVMTKMDADFYTETGRGRTNDAFATARNAAIASMAETALVRMRWEQEVRGLSPHVAHRETMEVVTRYLDAIRGGVEAHLNDLYAEMTEKGIR